MQRSSSPWFIVTLFFLHFTHSFLFCDFFSFLSQWAEEHSWRALNEWKRCRLMSWRGVGGKVDVDLKNRWIGKTRRECLAFSCLKLCVHQLKFLVLFQHVQSYNIFIFLFFFFFFLYLLLHYITPGYCLYILAAIYSKMKQETKPGTTHYHISLSVCYIILFC